MVVANELRIGNLVQEEFNRVGRVLDFGENWIRLKMEFSTLKKLNHKGVVGLQVEPVPLTEEWLTKAGFTIVGTYKDFTEWMSPDQDLWILFIKENRRFQYYYGPDDRYIDSIHQLQNLHFAVTGKELAPCLTSTK